MRHELKLHPKYFDDVKSGRKTFEVRYNDRNFKIDDILILNEYDNGFYTGRYIKCEIIYILDDFIGLQQGFVVLGIKTFEK